LHPYQRLATTFIRVGVLRSTSLMPTPRVKLSVQLRSGTWQLEHDSVPLAERRGSKKRRVPNSIASGFPETRLLGSACAGAGHGPWERMISISASLKTGFAESCCAGLVPASNAPIAAHAARIANRLFRSKPETILKPQRLQFRA